MDNYKINLSVDPTNKYEKAKSDVLKAMNSVDELDLPQKEKLLYEVVEDKAKLELFINFIKNMTNQ